MSTRRKKREIMISVGRTEIKINYTALTAFLLMPILIITLYFVIGTYLFDMVMNVTASQPIFSEVSLMRLDAYPMLIITAAVVPRFIMMTVSVISAVMLASKRVGVWKSSVASVICFLVAVVSVNYALFRYAQLNAPSLAAELGSLISEGKAAEGDLSGSIFVDIYLLLAYTGIKRFAETGNILFYILYAVSVPLTEYAPKPFEYYYVALGAVYSLLFGTYYAIEIGRAVGIKRRNKDRRNKTERRGRMAGGIVAMSMLVILPLINFPVFFSLYTHNYIDWDAYYGPPSSVRRYEGDGVISAEFLNNNISLYYRSGIFVMKWYGINYTVNTSGPTFFTSEYLLPIPVKNVPLFLYDGLFVYSDSLTYIRDGRPYYSRNIIPYNSPIWNYLTVICYVYDPDAGYGIGYRFGNRESIGPYDTSEVITEDGRRINVYDVNISGRYGISPLDFRYRILADVEISGLADTLITFAVGLFGFSGSKEFEYTGITDDVFTIFMPSLPGYLEPPSGFSGRIVGLYISYDINYSDVNFDGISGDRIYVTERSVFLGYRRTFADAFYTLLMFDTIYVAAVPVVYLTVKVLVDMKRRPRGGVGRTY